MDSAILYIEARLQDDVELRDFTMVQEILERELAKKEKNLVFQVGENLLNDQRYASLALRGNYKNASSVLHSLNVVEYVGPANESTYYSTNNVAVRVQMYKLCTTNDDKDVIPQGETTYMPHINFNEIWDDLIFGTDIKGELIATMTNILRFSKRVSQKRAAMNPLILLHGPPGTGKTTLCQGLAQKVAIRLKDTYKVSRLIQIRTATLLSKFYSESAKQVDKIFTTIERMCDDDHEQFICVLIDEVESIASSREASMHGEAQDSLRATNSLLTGLDRVGKKSNVVFLCTSNMLGSLDLAFLDRCGIRIPVIAPAPAIQYEILRMSIYTVPTRCDNGMTKFIGLHGLIADGIITPKCAIPCYRDAELEYVFDSVPVVELSSDEDRSNVMEGDQYGNQPNEDIGDLYGARLLRIVEQINKQPDGEISGRSLTQLPEMSILRHLRSSQCNLNMAYSFMEICINSVADSSNATTKEHSWEVVVNDESSDTEVQEESASSSNGKRERDEDELDLALKLVERVASTLREAKRSKRGQ
ncbi:P-loop containing nucleoside triphosphate hydrolase protein [Calycina marina]|uniref:P-loop containing nucleoside triphosphate hydrolase protein n=1 Tax=Calycina marina TaxID=1763456 RepID=A0A9P8CE38_9HELO|nr:P-loop containing nucleoside triphosphate hydrolase protein [Calycina marina]